MPPASRKPLSRRLRPVSCLVAALALAVAGCGAVEWPLRRAQPDDINRPSPAAGQAAVTSPAFANAAAVTAGRGDTVYALSRRHRVPVRAIIEANGLKPPYHLKAGQRVELPRGRRHTIRRGDTLYAIAAEYGVDPYAMARANGLGPPYEIISGDTLVVPVAARAPAAPAPNTVETAARSAPKPRPAYKAKPPPPAVPRPPRASGEGFLWPVQGKVISGFGTKAKGFRNDGINIAAERGAPVIAAENGVVAYAGNELRGFGNLLLIKHADGWVTAYAHTDRVLVKRGDKVTKGQQIATVGSTGNVRSPQLHFEMRRGRTARDPKKYLRRA